VAFSIVLKYNIKQALFIQPSHIMAKTHSPPVLINPSDERRILDLRPLGFRDVIVLGRYRYTAVHPALEDHSHGKMMEICFLEQGEQTYFVGEERFDLNGGDVFVTYPGEKHGTGPSPEGKGVLYWMLLNMPNAKERFLSLDSAAARQLTNAILKMPARRFKANDSIGRTLRHIFTVYDRNGNPLRKIELQNLLLRLLLDVIEASHKSQHVVTPVILGVQEYVDRNIDSVFTVRQLARLTGLSETRFKSRFKAETGIPPADYVMRKKIDRAQLLFQSEDVSVTEVAMRLGFSTSHYFATVFRRYTGQTPSQFRKLCRHDGD